MRIWSNGVAVIELKRRNFEIKDLLLEALEKYPQNASQLSKRIGSNLKTVKRHLEDLQDFHRVQKVTKQVRGKEKKVWELVK